MNIEEKIESGAYEVKEDRPSRPKQRCSNVDCNYPLRAKDAFCSACATPSTYAKREGQYHSLMKEYRRSEALCLSAFKSDLLADLGVADHKRKDLFFDLMWSLGHSSGYTEVYNHAIDFVGLLE